jgi:hypothetical protein
MNKRKWFYHVFLISSILLSLVLHKEYLSLDIQGVHSWRQSQTMWNVRNFVRHDANILNPRISHFNINKNNIYRYEFPLMQWSIAMIQKVGGEKIEIARLLIFLIGTFSVFGIYFLTNSIFKDKRTALFTAFLFQFTPVFFYYTINPIPDNLALAGAIWYLYFILLFEKSNKTKHLVLASFFLLMAMLAKLPYLMFAVVSLLLFFNKLRIQKSGIKDVSVFVATQVLIIIPGILWYLWVMSDWKGNPVLSGVFESGLSLGEYREIIMYHVKTMFPKILLSPPVWLLFVIGLYGLIKEKVERKWMLSLVFVSFTYLLLQLNTINTVHDYYMMPFLPWLFLVIAFGINELLKIKSKYKLGLLLIVIICAFSPIYTFKHTSSNWSLERTYFNKDVFIHSDALKSIIPNEAKCIILNDVSGHIFSYQIDKMGYVFSDDYLPVHWIEDMVKNYDINYMYSDSEKINSDPDVADFIDEMIFEAGSVKVFRLKMKE